MTEQNNPFEKLFIGLMAQSKIDNGQVGTLMKSQGALKERIEELEEKFKSLESYVNECTRDNVSRWELEAVVKRLNKFRI